MSKVVICGSRGFIPPSGFGYILDGALADNNIDTIISGGAKGADSFAADYALVNGYYFIEIKPDWDKHGKKAGYLRNIDMIEQGGVELVLALWDGKSKGTKHSIDAALARGINTHVIFYENYI